MSQADPGWVGPALLGAFTLLAAASALGAWAFLRRRRIPDAAVATLVGALLLVAASLGLWNDLSGGARGEEIGFVAGAGGMGTIVGAALAVLGRRNEPA